MKGAIAKQNVIDKIAAAFGSDYIGVNDKKLYVWSTEGGEPMQVCIALTIPKNPISTTEQPEVVMPKGGKLDFEDMPPKQQTIEPAKITEKEQQLAEDLLKRLGF